MEHVNPATEEKSVIKATAIESIPAQVASARTAQVDWSKVPVSQRSEILKGLRTLITEDRLRSLSQCISNDMGKPVARAEGEIKAALVLVDYLCDHAAQWLAAEDAPGGKIHYQPLGLIGVVSPWNFPFYVPLTAIIPALCAGNGVIFKPSEHAPGIGIEIARLFQELESFPENLLQTVIGAKEHGKAVVNADVQMISFTGSTAAGKHIMSACSGQLKRTLLELGGMDPAIVLSDADLDDAAKKIVRNNCDNTGQVCCAIKRVYVERAVYHDFVAKAVENSRKITFGAPDSDVHMGPLVAGFQREKVADIVEDARTKGATVHSGGEIPDQPGYYYPSTILTDVTAQMRVLTEEPFGPVLPIIPVESSEEAIRLANASDYGLTGSVWTGDPQGKGLNLAKQLEVGQAHINTHGSGPVGCPFGGAKQSGIGRAKSRDGMRSYCNTKYINLM